MDHASEIRTSLLTASVALALSGAANAETLRLLTWSDYAPDNIIELFDGKYPDINVEVRITIVQHCRSS